MCIILILSFYHWHNRRRKPTEHPGYLWDNRNILADPLDPPSPPTAYRPPMSDRSPVPSSAPLLNSSKYTPTPYDAYSPLSLIGSGSGSRQAASSNLNLTAMASSSDLSSSRVLPQVSRTRLILHQHQSVASSSRGSPMPSQLPLGAAPPIEPLKHQEAMMSVEPQPSVIIQHLDGGAGDVQELPPPYIGEPKVDEGK